MYNNSFPINGIFLSFFINIIRSIEIPQTTTNHPKITTNHLKNYSAAHLISFALYMLYCLRQIYHI